MLKPDTLLPSAAPLPARRDAPPVNVPLMDVTLDRRGLLYGLLFSFLLTLAVYFGSQRFHGFDGALAGYCFATIFALFGVVYRYVVWLQRPADLAPVFGASLIANPAAHLEAHERQTVHRTADPG
ncbi:hypothetical protein, partial [Deinococcus ficus]|uniref:hypothetical protein n=1 Tax=Deinococcus ficus TaxID=317577 RepID=UPI001E2C633A